MTARCMVISGQVVTGDPERPRAQALAVAGGEVVAVGSLEDARRALPGAPVEEVAGTVIPGLIDSHVHLQWTGLSLLRRFGDGPLPDVQTCLAALMDGGPSWDVEPALDDRLAGLRQGQRLLHGLGITGVVDPAVTPAEMAGYQESWRRGELTMRVVAMPHVTLEEGAQAAAARLRGPGVRTGFGDDRLRIGAVKVYYDGQGRAGTALLREPWPGTGGYHGERLVDRDEFRRFAAICARERWALGVHVVGSGGIDEVLDAFAAAHAEAPIDGLGFTLIHAYLDPSPANMAAARELGVLVAAQPSIQWVNGAGLVERLGAAGGLAAPLRSWRAAGVRCGGGSDAPDFPLDPRLGMWQAMTRCVDGGGVLGPEEALDGAAALELYTAGAAAVSLAESRRGRIAPAMLADLTVLSVDPLACSAGDLRDAVVLRTVVGGRTVSPL